MKKAGYIVLAVMLTVGFFLPFTSYDKAKAAGPAYGIVNFKTKACSQNTDYIEVSSGRAGYVNGCSAPDAAFLGYSADGGSVKFKLSGVTGWVAAGEVQVLDMEAAYGKGQYFTSYYIADGGTIDHYVNQNITSPSYSGFTIGRNTIGLREGIAYLSYDGHYFYEDNVQSFRNMINDYKNGSSEHAVNAGNPYYSYYQYLSHRTASNYSSGDIVYDLVNYVLPTYPNSKLSGTENTFFQAQNTYGTNAIMMYSLAKHESASGSSQIAQSKNNLFGHNATDAAPGTDSYYFNSPNDNIIYHSKRFLSEGYLDVCDWADTKGGGYNEGICNRGRYYGPHFGNKASGINVKYASDPYWGEKAAGAFFRFDKRLDYQDFNKYRIGIKTTTESVAVRKDPNHNATILYKTGSQIDVPFVVLKEVRGTTVNGSDIWYQVQSDTVLNDSRTALVQMNGAYNFSRDIGYIHSSAINVMVNPQVSIPTESVTYDITFKADGGKFNDGSDTKVITVTSGTIPAVDAPTRNGYIFLGWDRAVDAASATTTYTARWEKQKVQYDITLKANGGQFADGSDTKVIKVEEGTKPVLEEPEKDGSIFTGWDKAVETVTGNATYTAQYREITDGDLIKKTGRFDLDYLKEENGELKIKGYSTIDGINNTKDKKFTYQLVFQNLDDHSIAYQQDLNRVTNQSEFPYQVPSLDGKDYTYAWFEGTIHLKDVPAGNYKVFLQAKSGIYASVTTVNNQLFRDQVTSFEKDGKYLLTRNNYFDPEKPIEFVVRNEQLGEKTTYALSNQFDQFYTFEFNKDGEFHVKGVSFSDGMDLSQEKADSLERKLIFENMKTFEKKEVDLGSTTEKEYDVKLPVDDGYNKLLAWYDKSFDLTILNLEKGKYVLYLSTKSNVKDIGEFSEQMFRDDIVNKAKLTKDGKTYSFSINYDQRYRIELTVQ